MARFVVGLMMVTGLLAGGTARLTFVNARLLILRGILGGVGVMIFYLSIVEIGLARGTVITYSYPIFGAIGGSLFLKERLSGRHWLLIGLAFAGLYFTIRGDTSAGSSSRGMELVALLGAMVAGLVVVMIRKLRETDSVSSIFAAQCIGGMAVVAWPVAGGSLQVGAEGWVLLAGIGLLAGTAQLLMTYSYKHLPVALGSLLGMLCPVMNVLIGLCWFEESINAVNAAGIALVFLACAAMSRL